MDPAARCSMAQGNHGGYPPPPTDEQWRRIFVAADEAPQEKQITSAPKAETASVGRRKPACKKSTPAEVARRNEAYDRYKASFDAEASVGDGPLEVPNISCQGGTTN